MFGFGRTTSVAPEALLAKAQSIALSYQSFSLERLNRNVPPGLLGMIWSLTLHVHEKMFEARKMLKRDEALKFHILAGEAFAFHAIAGFGSMDPDDIEDAKLVLDECMIESRSIFDRSREVGAQEALRDWSRKSELGGMLLNDDRVGPVALAALLGCMVDSVSSAKK